MAIEVDDALADTLIISARFADGSESCQPHRVLKCESTLEYLSWYLRNPARRGVQIVAAVRATGYTAIY